jgi:hypothetical protein
MRSNVICSFAAVFASFTQFAAVFVAFALPVLATANQPAGAIPKVSVTQEESVRGVVEVIVKAKRAI